MIDTIDAEDAWCPPTLRPDGFGRTRFAWWIIAVDSQSTRFSISRSTPYSCAVSPVVRRGLVAGPVIVVKPPHSRTD